MEVEFRNITITIGNVTSPKEAYDVLCDLLGSPEAQVAEWTTDTYVVHTGNHDVDATATAHDTYELFPEDGS